ncbi:BhlA/UviB family holin-like peptide [Clostridium sp. UBA1652]|uniref:BhlA/UviB family holin-like peptide n=1 Tax=Clostridium sp. UBA1652 TaxID=1946348 RepID=UPI00257CD561|nr:BhlA/UviB family holin-like peptide [Clostridium sp. UBA1652]
MESELIKMALSQGIWSVLSIFLIFYILKKQDERDLKQAEREEKYQSIIDNLSTKLSVIDTIKTNIDEIKDLIEVQ